MANSGSLKFGRGDEEDASLGDEQLRLGRKRKKPTSGPSAKSPWSGSSVPKSVPPNYPGKGSTADAKARLNGVVKRSRQVLVKIPRGGRKTAKDLRKHFEYLSKQEDEKEQSKDGGQARERAAQPLFDESGRRIEGEDAIAELAELWKRTGPRMSDSSDRTEAFHIIFSMPEGTDAQAVHSAVRATAQVEFAGHQWVMAQHFDEPQVHCHVSVRAEGFDGRRLNPRKGDLSRWRERFAHELRERNVEAEATRRRDRLQREKVNEPWAAAQLRKRGRPTNPAPEDLNEAAARKWNAAEKETVERYAGVATELQSSGNKSDQKLAEELAAYVKDKLEKNQKTDRLKAVDIATPEVER